MTPLVNLPATPADRPSLVSRDCAGSRVLLIKPPFFTPWTPPLGMASLKAFIQKRGGEVTCVDLNVDSVLWNTHHEYFAALQGPAKETSCDGYSPLWWILNAHLLARLNGADRNKSLAVVQHICPLFGVSYTDAGLRLADDLVDRFFRRLELLIDRIDFSHFTLVGTSTYTTSLASSLFILRRVKSAYPSVKTVVGGGVFA